MRVTTGPLARAWRHRDFRLLWTAQIFSEGGDWAARVALAVLVYNRTGSRVLTASVTGIGMLPWLGLGQALATLGDRFSRRRVMIVADIVRAAMFASMIAAPSIWLLLVLAFVAAAATPPFEAARAAMTPEVVPEDTYGDALTVTNITFQVVLVLGYLAGGGLVAWLRPQFALLVNAGTFLVSALLLSFVRSGRMSHAGVTVRASLGRAVLTLRSDPFLKRAAMLAMVASSCAMVGEALVAVYVRETLRLGDGAIGILAAAVPVGTIVAASLAPKKGSHTMLLRASAIITVVGGVAGVAGFLLAPRNLYAAIPYAGIGVIFAVIIPAQHVVGTRVPSDQRASVFGLLQGSLLGGQALASILGGFLASAIGAGSATAIALLPAIGFGIFAMAVPPRETASTTIVLPDPDMAEPRTEARGS